MQHKGGRLFSAIANRNYLKIIVATGFCLFFSFYIYAQDISFFHLSKKEGLNDNQVSAVTLDRDGLLWVGTTDGLNCYNGYTVKKFSKEEYPQLQHGSIDRLVCDKKNRLWIHFVNNQIALLDEDRVPHNIQIVDQGKPVVMNYLLPLTSRGVLLASGSKLFTPDEENPRQMHRVPWLENEALASAFLRINEWDRNRIVFSGENRLLIFDVSELKVVHDIQIPNIVAAVKLNDQEALVTTLDDQKLCRVNLVQKKIVKTYAHLKDQFGDAMSDYPRSIYHLKDGKYIFTSAYSGVYVFDPAIESLTSYRHDPANNRSVSSNNTMFIFSDSSGYFFISSNSAGINYFNINHYVAKVQPAFKDAATGIVFDGFINCFAEDNDGNIWIGTQNSLVQWNRRNETTQFSQYGTKNGKSLSGEEEVRALLIDNQNRIWVGLNRYGINVMDKKGKLLKNIQASGGKNSLPFNLVNDIKQAADGKVWVATSKGLCIINAVNYKIATRDSFQLLKVFNNKICHTIWHRNAHEVWVGTNKGAFRIDISQQIIKEYTVAQGLESNLVYAFEEDAAGNIYIGTHTGLNILEPGGNLKKINSKNGLINNRVDGLLKDESGNIWIGNDNFLLVYYPVSGQFVVYDQGVGLSDAGFRPRACFKSANGELYWGGEKGVSFFNPAKLKMASYPLKVMITDLIIGDSSYWLPSTNQFTFPYSKNTISLSFSGVDFYSSKNIVYQYRLSGVEDKWQNTTTAKQVLYSKLQPGNYRFLLRASRDGQNWVDASNTIGFIIQVPWWKSRWFTALYTITIAALVLFIIYNRNKKARLQREQLETEQAINFFATGMYTRSTVDEILWDVTKNCINRLHFEDCVIYLKDEVRNVLVPKAAWGPKIIGDNKISDPLEIPVGSGITGSVAQTGKAEIVGDTSIDQRYIVDDMKRNSEITVPIISDGNVLGVIDSEHSKKGFFTQRHLSILTTIASLVANKIVRVKAEKEKQLAQFELLNHQRKIAEARLKSLRLQMNPHFLFNSLNSIQQIILSGDDTNATNYLSSFSRLLRLVLHHSDKEKISLREEMESLQLYVELESLRFRSSFQYEISCDESIDQEEIKVPTLLIQPFIENAIWHGLLHKEGMRLLKVRFTEDEKDNLVCVIEDNGIGREATVLKDKENHSGKGIGVAEERVQLFNEQYKKRGRIKIVDLCDPEGRAAGTRVIITLPLLS